MTITVTMTPEELEAERAKFLALGRKEGHQSALYFLQQMLKNPNQPVEYTRGFPDDLRKTVDEVVTRLRKTKST